MNFRPLTVRELKLALIGVPDDTVVYVRTLNDDVPGEGGRALSAGMEEAFFVVAGDDEEWRPATMEQLMADLDDEEDAEDGDG